jgi:branched-subunit amino acid ABC-type transport system permease component
VTSNFWIAAAVAVLSVALLGALTEVTLLRPLHKRNNPLYVATVALPYLSLQRAGLVGQK